MANFCKYCGSSMMEGQECNCEGAVKAREASNATSANVPTQNEGSMEQEKKTESAYAKITAGNTSLNILETLKKSLHISKSFLLNPVETLKVAFSDGNKTEQLVTGGIMTFILWVLMFVLIKEKHIGGGIAFKYSFLGTLFLAALRVAYGSAVYFFVRNDSDKKYVSVLSLSAITMTLDAVMMIAIVLLKFMSLYELGAVFVLIIFASTVVSSMAVTFVATDKNMSKTVKITLLLQIIFVIVSYYLTKSYIQSELNNLYGDYIRMFGGFPGL